MIQSASKAFALVIVLLSALLATEAKAYIQLYTCQIVYVAASDGTGWVGHKSCIPSGVRNDGSESQGPHAYDKEVRALYEYLPPKYFIGKKELSPQAVSNLEQTCKEGSLEQWVDCQGTAANVLAGGTALCIGAGARVGIITGALCEVLAVYGAYQLTVYCERERFARDSACVAPKSDGTP